MTRWRDRRVLDLLEIEVPIIQAPMAGSDSPALAAEVSRAGGLGSLAGALLAPQKLREGVHAIRAVTSRPINLNFFCHTMTPSPDPAPGGALEASACGRTISAGDSTSRTFLPPRCECRSMPLRARWWKR